MMSLKSHNVSDYVLGAAFLITPFLLGFSGMYFAHDVFTVLGFAIIGYSLLTDYRYSMAKAVPFSMHITFDVIVGIFAILAPWVYGYAEDLTLPQMLAHWVLGLGAIATAFMTSRHAERPSIVLRPADPNKAAAAEAEQERWKKAA
jgi:hypothetical protein